MFKILTNLFKEKVFKNRFNYTDKQKQILNSSPKYKIIQGIRQSSKTTLIVHDAIKEALTNRNVNLIIYTHSHNVINLIKNCIVNEILINTDEIPTINQYDCIGFQNGSKIYIKYGKSINNNSFQGLKIKKVYFDELALFGNFNSIYDDISNYVINRCNSDIMICSTRTSRSKKNTFWKLWTTANMFDKYTITQKDIPYFNFEYAKQRKKHLSRSQYENEFTIRQK